MHITVTFRHVDPTSALRTHAEERLARVTKYVRRAGEAHVILGVSKERHVAEVTLQADHVTMFAKEETHDLYTAIDLAVEKLVHQAQKLKAKRRDRKRAGAVHAGPGGGSVESAQPLSAEDIPRLVETRQVPAKRMSVVEAVAQLERSDDVFLMFTNKTSQRVAVAYRRRDGHYGLIESAGR